MGVVSRRWVWVESMGVFVRRYIDFLILLIPAPLVSVLFCSSILLFLVHFLNVFRSCSTIKIKAFKIIIYRYY